MLMLDTGSSPIEDLLCGKYCTHNLRSFIAAWKPGFHCTFPDCCCKWAAEWYMWQQLQKPLLMPVGRWQGCVVGIDGVFCGGLQEDRERADLDRIGVFQILSSFWNLPAFLFYFGHKPAKWCVFDYWYGYTLQHDGGYKMMEDTRHDPEVHWTDLMSGTYLMPDRPV